MPSQNFIDSSPNEFGIFRRKDLRFNELRHDRERSQEVVAVRARRPQCCHRCVQVIEEGS